MPFTQFIYLSETFILQDNAKGLYFLRCAHKKISENTQTVQWIFLLTYYLFDEEQVG